MNDDALIREAQRGDPNAFAKLIRLYQKKIYNFALRLSRDRDLSQDLCQEAFLKAFLNIRTFKGNASFSTWIYRIVHNTFLDHYRKEALAHQSWDAENDVEGSDEMSLGQFREQLKQVEYNDWLTKGLLRLPFPFRSVLVLRDIQGFSYEEIAEITDSSVGTVKSRLNRARERLRKILLSME